MVERARRARSALFALAAATAAVGVGFGAGVAGAAPAGASGSSTPPAGSADNTATAQSPYPVTYSVVAAGAGFLTDPTASPPGANIWTCKPSAAHPDPVVLVHGLVATMADNWPTFAPLLADNGYCVYALTYGLDPGEQYLGGLQPMQDSSHQLAAFVDRVLAATGASKVDLVGHSEGTVMPQYYLKFLGGAAKVNRYVAIAPLYKGTTLDSSELLIDAFEAFSPSTAAPLEAAVATECGSCQEFLSGSAFLQHLYADGVYAVPGVTYTTIMTEYDELVTPYTSGYLDAPNATNFVVQHQCPLDFSEHATLAFDPVVAQDVLNALDPSEQHPVPCTLVLPGVGAPQFP
ncbi:MAG: lipase family alpha/beta hydrolase [Acidimicrobiales bacterium]